MRALGAVSGTPQLLRTLKSLGHRLSKRLLSDAASMMGVYKVAASKYAGLGVVLTLHRVTQDNQALQPGYTITADWLDFMLGEIRRSGFEIITLDEVGRRLTEDRRSPRFVCITLDDGYADNLEVALPVFQKHKAPFTVYITTGFLDRSIFYWWGGLEQLVLETEYIEAPSNGTRPALHLKAGTWLEKRSALERLDALCHREGPDVARELFEKYRVDAQLALHHDALTIEQARELAQDPLVTIGAHGVTHQRLSRMSAQQAREDICDSGRLLNECLGVEVRHLAYPYGGPDACEEREFGFAREAGFSSAVTTRRGNIFPEHVEYKWCLPRRNVPLNVTGLRNALSGVESVFRREPVFRTA